MSGAFFRDIVTTKFLSIPTIKNFENRLIFDEVIGAGIQKLCQFFWPTLYILTYGELEHRRSKLGRLEFVINVLCC